jgi:hypothetical protein
VVFVRALGGPGGCDRSFNGRVFCWPWCAQFYFRTSDLTDVRAMDRRHNYWLFVVVTWLCLLGFGSDWPG